MLAWSPRSFSSTLFGMKKGFVIFQTFYLVKILLKLLKIWLLNLTFLLSDRRKYNSLMNGIYLDWFQNSTNIQENVFDKICSSLVCEKKSQSMFIPFWGTRHLLRLKTNGLIVWMSWMKWNGIIFIMPTSSAPLKPSWSLFFLKFFKRQSY